MIRFASSLIAIGLASSLLTPCEEPVDPPVEECVVTGCSGQLCASEPMASTCEWTCEYGCYQYATCETQAAGVCGWTPSDAYNACVDDCNGFEM